MEALPAMSQQSTRILSSDYLAGYLSNLPKGFKSSFVKIQWSTVCPEERTLSIQLAASFSCLIEGVPMDIDTYLRHKELNLGSGNKDFQQVENLISAYIFSQEHYLNIENILNAHHLLAFNIKNAFLTRGSFRTNEVGVYRAGKLIYSAAPASEIAPLMEQLFNETNEVLKTKLSTEEAFYYAALVHLRFVQIHPFADGNGRMARLLEKWFLASALVDQMWELQSEQNYYMQLRKYYQNLNLGPSWHELDIKQCIPFLLMLPAAMKISF